MTLNSSLGPNGWTADIPAPVSGGGVPAQPAASCLRAGTSVVGWTLSNVTGATATMAMEDNSPFGGPGLKVTIPNDVGAVDVIASGLGVTNFTSAGAGKIVCHVYVPDELGIKQIRPYVGISGLSRSMDYTYPLSNNNQFRHNGHHIIAVHADTAATNTLLSNDTVDDVRIRINAQTAGGVVWIGGVYIPAPEQQQWMVVTVDDADISMYTRFHAQLAARGMKGTFNINWDQVGTNNNLFVTQAQLQAMYDYGHDMTSHNRVNTNYPSATLPTAQPSDAARLTYCTAFRYTREIMRGLGWTRALGFHAYVQGAHDGALGDAMRAHGVTFTRGANSNRNVEPFMLGRQGIISQRSLGSVTTLADSQNWVAQALARKQDICVMGHELRDTPTSTVTWAESDFGAMLDYANASGMRVGSVSEWLSERGVVV